jgi:hypothetical protein
MMLHTLLREHHLHDAGLIAVRRLGDRAQLVIELPESDPVGGVVSIEIWPCPGALPVWHGAAQILALTVKRAGDRSVLYLGAIPDADPSGYYALEWAVARAKVQFHGTACTVSGDPSAPTRGSAGQTLRRWFLVATPVRLGTAPQRVPPHLGLGAALWPEGLVDGALRTAVADATDWLPVPTLDGEAWHPLLTDYTVAQAYHRHVVRTEPSAALLVIGFHATEGGLGWDLGAPQGGHSVIPHELYEPELGGRGAEYLNAEGLFQSRAAAARYWVERETYADGEWETPSGWAIVHIARWDTPCGYRSERCDSLNGPLSLADRFERVLVEAVSSSALLDCLDDAHAAGLQRRAMYDALHGAYTIRQPALTEQECALIEDVLDRVWGFCPQRRCLFPELPPLTDA